MIEVPLTKGLKTIVDDSDAHLSRYKWYLSAGGYAMHGHWNNKKTHKIFMHHAILGRPLNGFVVDHMDGNKLNNTRNNLRIVSHRENDQNKNKLMKTSKYSGVCFYNKHGNINKPWKSSIRIEGKSIWLGSFETEEKASYAYQEALKNVSH